ncbi:MAG: polyprenyl synthetase family protein [Alphaproteobacteria bacterium]|nr:polyprenyl synthetase family protein [Alphaproteobacteria bacterium]
MTASLNLSEKDQSEKNTSSSLKPLLALSAHEMGQVNELIIKKAQSHVKMIPELAKYLVDSGGKRLRPMLTLISAQICNYSGISHIALAATVEFMHTATLLHDDVVDKSDMRRNKKTARLLWGNQASILVGDYLLAQAFKMMIEIGSLDILEVLSNTAAIIAEGEVWQLSNTQNINTTEEYYLAVIRSKSAVLFSAATEVGAIIASADNKKREAIRDFGLNLGIAFQLIDDVLDYTGKDDTTGKTIGDDFREGKITLPVILSYQRSDDDGRAFWNRIMQEERTQEKDFEKAIAMMQKQNTITDTIERAQYYAAIACDSLALFPQSEQKSALLETASFCVKRAY